MRNKRYVELIERLRQPESDNFDKRLFARPAFEKSGHLVTVRKRIERLNLTPRKETARNIRGREVCANVLDINAKLTVLGKGKQRDSVRV
jgi:hypothetical protein